jgi:hypothetical protein
MAGDETAESQQSHAHPQGLKPIDMEKWRQRQVCTTAMHAPHRHVLKQFLKDKSNLQVLG